MSNIPPGHEWQPAPLLTETQLTGSFWSFGMLGAGMYSPFLVLAPGGLLGLHQNPNEDLWDTIGGRLAFTSSRGAVTTLFEAVQVQDGQIVALAGRILVPGYDAFHELRRVAHPAHPTASTAPDQVRQAPLLVAKGGGRSNLVILRAGDQSLHTQWARDISDSERNWDLCLTTDTADWGRFAEGCEYLAHLPSQHTKFPAIYDLFHDGSALWEYDRIWLPDDDLQTSWGDINRMFHLARRYDLDLAQPSLQQRPDGYVAHWFTGQQSGCILRYVGFVELMCPLFSQRALRICLGSFRDNASGAGLEQLWPGLLGAPRTRMAVIDDVSVAHARPPEDEHDVRQAHSDAMAVLRPYQWRNNNLPPLKLPVP